MTSNQPNMSFLRNKISLESRSSSVRIKMLKNLIKLLYDDISYEIVNYIINLNGEKAEEQSLADKLNLNYTQIRQSLIHLGKHGILIPSEYKKKRVEEEEEKIQQKQLNTNRLKTSEWELNELYYNIVKNRFEDLTKKLETNLKSREIIKFKCAKCDVIYNLEKVAHIFYKCPNCIDKPSLTQIKEE